MLLRRFGASQNMRLKKCTGRGEWRLIGTCEPMSSC